VAEGWGKPENLPNQGQDPCEEEGPFRDEIGRSLGLWPGDFFMERACTFIGR